MKKRKKSLEKQERLNSALWGLIENNNEMPKNITCDGVKVSREAISLALKTIMGIFGYEITEIQ